MASAAAPAPMATAGIVVPVPIVPGATVIARSGRLQTVPTVRCVARALMPAPGPTARFAIDLTGLHSTHEASRSA